MKYVKIKGNDTGEEVLRILNENPNCMAFEITSIEDIEKVEDIVKKMPNCVAQIVQYEQDEESD